MHFFVVHLAFVVSLSIRAVLFPEVLRKAQGAGFPNLVVDAAYRKNRTHNENTIVLDALKLSPEQNDALIESASADSESWT